MRKLVLAGLLAGVTLAAGACGGPTVHDGTQHGDLPTFTENLVGDVVACDGSEEAGHWYMISQVNVLNGRGDDYVSVTAYMRYTTADGSKTRTEAQTGNLHKTGYTHDAVKSGDTIPYAFNFDASGVHYTKCQFLGAVGNAK